MTQSMLEYTARLDRLSIETPKYWDRSNLKYPPGNTYRITNGC